MTHSFIKSIPKPITSSSDLRDQNKNKTKNSSKKTSILSSLKENSPKVEKYELTPLPDFAAIKSTLLNSIHNKNSEVAAILSLFPPIEIAAHKENTNLFSPFVDNKNVADFLYLSSKGMAMHKQYVNKLQAYMARLCFLHKTSFIISEHNREAINLIISKYITKGTAPVIPCKDLAQCLTEISPDLLSTMITALDAGNSIDSFLKDPNYSFIFKLDTVLPPFFTSLNNQFRTCYLLFKDGLNLIRTSAELHDPEFFKDTFHTLRIELQLLAPPSLTNFNDPHYFFTLLRVHMAGPQINEPYPLPLFNTVQLNQIKGYLNELCDMLLLLFYLKKKYNLSVNIFSKLPVTKLINKKPSLFFNNEVKNHTFSLLLEYLSGVNASFLQLFLESIYSELPKI